MPEPEIVTTQSYNNVNTSAQQGSTKVSSGSIAGVVLGVLLLLAPIAGGWWLWRRKRARRQEEKHSDTLGGLQDHSKQAPAEPPYQARIEVGARNPRPEMYVPPKPHEMGAFNGENVRFEVWAPPVFYEMGDMSGKDVGVFRPDPDLMRKM